MNHESYAGAWTSHPDAARFVENRYRELLHWMPDVSRLADRVHETTSSRLFDYLDHLVLPREGPVTRQLEELGFVEEHDVRRSAGETSFFHPEAVLPRIVTRRAGPPKPERPLEISLHVENLATFLMSWGRSAPIEGPPLAPYRRAVILHQNGCRVLVSERRATLAYLPRDTPAGDARSYLLAFERWSNRARHFAQPAEGVAATRALADELVGELGRDAAAWIAFEGERAYWQQRNLTARVQKRRQDSFGLGWSNHDHHTFRSSRSVFFGLIALLESFGFRCREQFYAGAEAGWGAQVLEHPVCRIVIFADVDLAPEEVDGDFAHEPLAPREELGTVGLWCALHGESILEAGLHHLAARFDFDAFQRDITREGRRMLEPFSDTDVLRQAFSQGERWRVSEQRLGRLHAAGVITDEQRDRFAHEGALGSHIESIQRGDGFKGFSQRGVSDIIRRTDPRTSSPDAS